MDLDAVVNDRGFIVDQGDFHRVPFTGRFRGEGRGGGEVIERGIASGGRFAFRVVV